MLAGESVAREYSELLLRYTRVAATMMTAASTMAMKRMKRLFFMGIEKDDNWGRCEFKLF
jgi:hypothetical protein